MNNISMIVSFIMTLQHKGLLSYQRLMYHSTWNSDLLCSGFNQNVYGWFNPLFFSSFFFFFFWLVFVVVALSWSWSEMTCYDLLRHFQFLMQVPADVFRLKKLTSISIDHVQARTSSMSFHGKSSFIVLIVLDWEKTDVPVEWTFSKIKFTVMRTSFDHDKLWNFMQRCLCAK